MVDIGWNPAMGGVGIPELVPRYLRLSSGPDFKLVTRNPLLQPRQMSVFRYQFFGLAAFEFNRELQVIPDTLTLADLTNAEQFVLYLGADHEIIQY